MEKHNLIPASLELLIDRIIINLKEGFDTALVAAPGCGTSTLTQRIKNELHSVGFRVYPLDLLSVNSVSDAIQHLQTIVQENLEGKPKILFIDHAGYLLPDDHKMWMRAIHEKLTSSDITSFWVGSLDARSIYNEFGFRIHARPRAHISFPVLPRDELLSTYRLIAENSGCKWGESILFLLLDLCGNDLNLVYGITEYLYGDWTSKLYDISIWDRINEWLANDLVVSDYRQRLNELPEPCKRYLTLIRLGGKPPCFRTELLEEVDDALRTLYLGGFIIPNLLPGFYQLRNLTIHSIVQAPFVRSNRFALQLLFRKATNMHVTIIIQDIETMMRSMLFSAFQMLGETEVRTILENIQSDREYIPKDLNKALFNWADEAGISDLRKSLGALLTEHRIKFKKNNSVWVRVSRMMENEQEKDDDPPIPDYLRYIDYLTFSELGVILIRLLDVIFPGIADDVRVRTNLESRWRENISKILRLRNLVAHLRNVDFQDMEDLVGTVESMRKDLISFTGWR